MQSSNSPKSFGSKTPLHTTPKIRGLLLLYVAFSLLGAIFTPYLMLFNKLAFYGVFKGGLSLGFINAVAVADSILTLACVVLIARKLKIARYANIALLTLGIISAPLLYNLNEVLFTFGFNGLWVLYFISSFRVRATLVL
ncbi:hypothetical protein LJB93_01860 [Desulfovibrio sp. OttesenSCG-928-F07]|nr:hypothetical protein [Desulfovibrio sp. OttesenSCG-928-F07]